MSPGSIALALALSASGGGPIPPSTPVTIGLILRNPGPKADKGTIARVKAMSAEERSARSDAANAQPGPADALIERLSEWLTEAGFRVASAGTNQVILATGTAAMVTRRFGVHLLSVAGKPPAVHTADGKPVLPEWVKESVAHVFGLDNGSKAKPPRPPSR